MAIQATTGTNNQTATSATPAKKKDVTKDDFLKLLISQLQNQDPLKPLDNQEFAQQLATFNSLEQLIGVNEKIGSLSDKLGNLADKILQSNNYNATGLLGKQVITDGDQLNLKEGEKSILAFKLSSDAARVTVDIKNDKEELVQRLEANKDLRAGERTLEWDGKNKAGKAAPAGLYTFEVKAFDSRGKPLTATGRIAGVVSGVNLDGAEPTLDVGGVQLPLSKVTTFR